MSQKAFFSILIPSKGGENYIENVLKSVLDQEFSDYEIIIGERFCGSGQQPEGLRRQSAERCQHVG